MTMSTTAPALGGASGSALPPLHSAWNPYAVLPATTKKKVRNGPLRSWPAGRAAQPRPNPPGSTGQAAAWTRPGWEGQPLLAVQQMGTPSHFQC